MQPSSRPRPSRHKQRLARRLQRANGVIYARANQDAGTERTRRAEVTHRETEAKFSHPSASLPPRGLGVKAILIAATLAGHVIMYMPDVPAHTSADRTVEVHDDRR